jgi:four helix bundle protein
MENKANELSARFLNFAASVFKHCKKIHTNQMDRHVVMQLFRSSTAIGANYEEARGAESRADFAHKVKLSLKEARETSFWLQFIIKSEIDKSAEIAELLKESQQICDILAKSIKTLQNNEKRKI